MQEWLNWPLSKSGVAATSPRVRIPPSPPNSDDDPCGRRFYLENGRIRTRKGEKCQWHFARRSSDGNWFANREVAGSRNVTESLPLRHIKMTIRVIVIFIWSCLQKCLISLITMCSHRKARGLEESSYLKRVKNMTDGNSLRIDRLRRVEVFRGAFSYLPLHNYLNGAYHRADMYLWAPPYGMMWQIPAFFVPNRVLLLVKTSPVVDDVREKLRAARALIEEMRPSLDRIVVRTVCHSPDRPYGNLPSNLVNVYRSSSGAASWSYEYNPYQVATWMLREYDRFIDEVMRSRVTPFTKLSRICQKVKTFRSMMDMVTYVMK